MIILSLDISTKSTGYAIYKDSILIDCGVSAAASTNVFDRIQKIANDIEQKVKEYSPMIIIAEEPEPAFVGRNIDIYRKLTFAHGAICMMLNKYNLTMQLTTSSHWRKMVGIKTGKGILRKELKKADIAKAKELFPKVEITNDDVADAILIGYGYILG